MHRIHLLAAVLLTAACAAPAPVAPVAQPFLRFEGLGSHSRKIGTSVPEAQRAFDQGLTFLYAFNHDEAFNSFTEVTRLDPQEPMGFWGVAMSRGPHINNSAVPPGNELAACVAAQRAVALRQAASEADRALIDAVAQRFANPQPADRGPLDLAYADAMRRAWKEHPSDADVGTLCAEALMDLHPWDLWTAAGEAKEYTPEIVAVIDGVLKLAASHPGALHLEIHAIEASAHPDRALAAADRLRVLVPASGHLCHMPSHIDVLLGHWDEAIKANELAIAADATYRDERPKQGFHHMYMSHNEAMLAFASMMDGRSALALKTSRKVLPNAGDFAQEVPPAIEPSLVILYDALVRFGRWDDLVAEPPPPVFMPVARVLWHHSRAVALAALGRVSEARAEQRVFRRAAADVPADRMMAINPAHRVFDIADKMLDGEILWREGDTDGAVARLREGIALEDQLAYMEPPEWPLPLRHALGAILLAAGRLDEAETAYREDLVNWPENGWSLHGLADCLHRRGAAEAAEMDTRFSKAWAQADIQIGSSCLCVATR